MSNSNCHPEFDGRVTTKDYHGVGIIKPIIDTGREISSGRRDLSRTTLVLVLARSNMWPKYCIRIMYQGSIRVG